MSLEVDPPELGFKRPFNHEVCEILHLRNGSQAPVVFKVKTTAPKHYCVRPNSGRVEPGKSVEVQVLLQAMKEEPALDAKCKDKFLVQSVAVTGDMKFANVTSIFEKASKAEVVECKIRVNWLTAWDPATPSASQEAADDEPPAYTSPVGNNFETPALPKKSAEESSPIPAPDFTEKPKSETSPQSSERPTSSIANARASVASAMPSADDLKTQLADANAQILRLKDRLADQGLRQRKTGTEANAAVSPATMQQQHAPSTAGVPIQVVALLCLLSFLVAYLFF